MKKWLWLGVLLSLSVSEIWAVDWKALQPQGYVSDFAGVIDPAGRARLDSYCKAVEQSTGAQIALVVIPSLAGEPIEDVANTIFRNWGVGQKGKNEGILLLLAINDRRNRLEIGYGLEPILPDGLDGSILRSMRLALRQGDYSDALAAAAEALGNAIATAKHVTLTERLPQQRRREAPGRSIPWPLVIGGVAVVLWLLSSRGPRGYGGGGGGGGGLLAGLLLGNAMGRSTWGGRSSGGFGGFDSGDGFGGFGGGDSGGGGASSDW